MSATAALYCSHCGHVLSRQWLVSEMRERDVCAACHHVHYENPKVLVAGIIHWRDEILLCKRAAEPAKGRWCVPMGFLEKGETLEEALARELYEETRLVVPPTAFALYAISSLPHIDQVHVVYRAKLISAPTPIANKESTEVRMFSESKLPVAELAFIEQLRDPFISFFRQLRDDRFQVSSLTLGSEPVGRVAKTQVDSTS